MACFRGTVINTAACHPGHPGKYGAEVAPGVVGHIHQHLFSARLDMEVDGPNNTVVECDTIAPPLGPENPYGNAFYVKETVLASERKAMRNSDSDTMRYWKIINPKAKNWLDKPTGYKLEARSPVRPYTHPDSPSGKRSRFIQHQLWVTPFDPNERYPAGEFVNQSTGDDGLPAWTAKDRSIEDTDVVLWHSFGVHHLPRPEDHPVQPCVVCGFTLAPIGFVDQNPVIDCRRKRTRPAAARIKVESAARRDAVDHGRRDRCRDDRRGDLPPVLRMDGARRSGGFRSVHPHGRGMSLHQLSPLKRLTTFSRIREIGLS